MRNVFLALLKGLGVVGALAACVHAAAPQNGTWKAGAARRNITPEKLIWMSGYGGRTAPAEGKLTDLWAKCLVLEDPQGNRAAAVTLDLVGIDRDTAGRVCAELERRYGLGRQQVALLTSHTHTGPVVGRNLAAMFFLTSEQWRDIDEYTARLVRDIVAVVGEAHEALQPADLAWGIGRATFAVNRRNNREADVPQLIETGQLRGPVDHDVPVLKVASGGKLTAVLFGYACHATVLSFQQWSGDYPGFAQIELERAHPGAVALFWAGCGADQNPLPRRKVELAQAYGKRLADAVETVLQGDLRPIEGGLSARFQEVPLTLAALPTREELERAAGSTNRYEARRAGLLLEQLEASGRLSRTYPYPVQVWHLGSELSWVILGGEVVVDYALRLKRELHPQAVWVAGYANDVMAYIPSLRVLREGGYEGGGAMLYYGLPSPWAEDVEETIVRAVKFPDRQP